MSEQPVRLGHREQQIVELLLQGCDNDEIARQLNMARRTVKAHFNRLFLRFGITSGIKRVKLATLLYRRQLCLEGHVTESEFPASERVESLNLLPKASKTKKSLTKSDFGTGSNSLSGTKPESTSKPPAPEQAEAWEHSILELSQSAAAGGADR